MTGPVERVPLTDERLQRLVDRLRASARQGLPAPDAVDEAVAELRASRVREQELRQRIDRALAWCHKANPRPDLNGDLFRDLIAALTGSEPGDSPVD